jgi:endoglucanase
MKGKRAMEIFDIVVEEITKAGIMIVMNNHISSSMWCCSTSDG